MRRFRTIIIFSVRVYRWTLSPLKNLLFGPSCRCRYQPSCSEYAIEALQTYGSRRGSWLSLKRICRCHPWGGCGFDPVPPKPGLAKSLIRQPPPRISRDWAPQRKSLSLAQTPGSL